MKNKTSNITASNITTLINECNKNFMGNNKLHLDKIEDGIAYITIGLHTKIPLYLAIHSNKMIIKVGYNIEQCEILILPELINFISMILLPWYTYQGELYLDIIGTDNDCKSKYTKVRECSGLEATLYTNSIILGVKLGFVVLTNAKLTQDNRIVVTNSNYENGSITINCADNTW